MHWPQQKVRIGARSTPPLRESDGSTLLRAAVTRGLVTPLCWKHRVRKGLQVRLLLSACGNTHNSIRSRRCNRRNNLPAIADTAKRLSSCVPIVVRMDRECNECGESNWSLIVSVDYPERRLDRDRTKKSVYRCKECGNEGRHFEQQNNGSEVFAGALR